MISPQYVDGLETRIEELQVELGECRKAMTTGLKALVALGCEDSSQADALKRALGETPAASRARLKAEWQAKAYTEALKVIWAHKRDTPTVRALEEVINDVEELRRQAEDKSND